MSELKKLMIGILSASLLIIGLLINATARDDVTAADPPAFYKAKCVACHGAKAEKKFDAALTDEQMVEIVLNGKKPEKPPNMPAYGSKGVTADQAKALVALMKQLKSAQ